jgi:hypothetical protein
MLSAQARDDQLHWWKTTANQSRHVDDVSAAITARGRHSRIAQRRSIRGQKMRVLMVTDVDRRTLTGTAGGRWLVAHADAMCASRPSRPRLLSRLTGICWMIAFIAAAFAITGAGGHVAARVLGLIVACLFTVAAMYVIKERRLALAGRLRSADRAATSATSAQAAQQALGGDRLYRTVAHQWWERTSTISNSNRLNRLTQAVRHETD